jgi:hypothetical protein
MTALAPFISSILFDEMTTSSAEVAVGRKNDAIGERQGMWKFFISAIDRTMDWPRASLVVLATKATH